MTPPMDWSLTVLNDKLPFIKTLRDFLPLKKDFLKHRWSLAAGLACLLLVDFLQLSIPIVLKRVIDDLTYDRITNNSLLRYAFIIIIIAVNIAVLRYFWRFFVIGVSRKIEEGLRNRLFQHLQTLSFSFYQRTKTGDIMARSINDIMAIRMATGMGLVSFVDGFIMGVSTIFLMTYLNPFLTLISLIPAPFIIFFVKRFTRRMASGFDVVQKTFSDLTERVREAFAGIRVVKAFARESWEIRRVDEQGKIYVTENIKVAKTMALFFPMMLLFNNLGLAIVIWLGGRLTILGNITTGDFVAFIGYLNLLTWPMMALGWVTNLFQRGAASMRRISRVLDERPEITGPAASSERNHPRGEIEFKGLMFKYPEKTQYALKGVSLKIEQGQTVSLVGRVGSGKTTLLYTIPRLLDVSPGMLLLDRKNITDFTLKDLRKGIGFITQDAIIFSDTIRNNVLIGREDISQEAVLQALKTAGLFDEIMDLKNGIDTLLGERGITLSGGQRQRLTIARAIVTDPPILIMDDSLSMVDTRTEEDILNNILSQRKGQTNIIVSHRLTTISRADIIAVLDKGELIESGGYGSIMNNAEFAGLYKQQALAQELDL
jgi:ATP-binding cassette, subfamily B, multidrug efflux pump